MKILVLGAAGVMGRRAASELARREPVTSLTVAARTAGSARRLAEVLGGAAARTSASSFDITDRSRLVEAMRAADVTVGCAGPSYAVEVDCVRAAIDAGTHYVSLADDDSVTARVLALSDAARDAEVTVVSGCGASPGLTNLLVALAADELDDVEEIGISIAVSSADRSGPASALHFVDTMAGDGTEVSDHSVERIRAATGPRLVYFPEPVGWVETFRCGHPEVTTLPTLYPELRTLRCRMGLTERAAMDILRAAVASGLLATELNRRAWTRLSEPVRPLLESLPPRGPAWTGLRVDVRGSADGRMRTVTYGVADRLTNLATLPLCLAAVEIGGGVARGVRTPEQAFDPRSFLNKVIAHGIRVARLEPERV